MGNAEPPTRAVPRLRWAFRSASLRLLGYGRLRKHRVDRGPANTRSGGNRARRFSTRVHPLANATAQGMPLNWLFQSALKSAADGQSINAC